MSLGPTSREARGELPAGRRTQSTCIHLFTHPATWIRQTPRALTQTQAAPRLLSCSLPFPKSPVKTLMQFQNSLPLHPTMCLPPLVSNPLLALKRDLGAAPSGWWWWFSCWTKGLRISWDRPQRDSQKVLKPVIWVFTCCCGLVFLWACADGLVKSLGVA